MKNKVITKKYIDANVLSEVAIYREIFNSQRYNYQIFTSHLAIGEAISNMILKKENIETINRFISIIKQHYEKGLLNIINSDFSNSHYSFFIDNTSLTGTDVVHLSLAIEEPQCTSFITCDSNFTNYNNLGKIIKNKFNRNFSIEKRQFKS